MEKRLKALRKEVGKTQAEFASDIMLSLSMIKAVETGNNKLSDRSIRDICRVYNVNEHWLLTGEGEMFVPPTREEMLGKALAKLATADDPRKDALISLVQRLTDDQIDEVFGVIESLAEANEEYKKKKPTKKVGSESDVL